LPASGISVAFIVQRIWPRTRCVGQGVTGNPAISAKIISAIK
jgi:hypothetical protein